MLLNRPSSTDEEKGSEGLAGVPKVTWLVNTEPILEKGALEPKFWTLTVPGCFWAKKYS